MAFIPRTSITDPTQMQDNPWWYSNGNKYYASGYGLPNCTCYCCGRVGEYKGEFDARIPNGDGGQWFPNAVAADNVPYGNEPALGAIACWYDPNGTYLGHVAIVEEIYPDGSLMLSNSGYPSSYFWTATVTPQNNYTEQWALDRGYVLQGFLYFYEEPKPKRRKMPIWMMLRNYSMQFKR